MTTPPMNGQSLTTHEATIQTAQVEIQVLKVGKKQVTMGMFLQLPHRPLVNWWAIVDAEDQGWWDEESPLRVQGLPWGPVNSWWAELRGENQAYFSEQRLLQSDRGDGLHLVWQDQERLYRDVVWQRVPEPLFETCGPHDRYPTPLLQDRRSEIVRWWQATWEELTTLPQLFIAV
jgi:hypothetical protein